MRRRSSPLPYTASARSPAPGWPSRRSTPARAADAGETSRSCDELPHGPQPRAVCHVYAPAKRAPSSSSLIELRSGAIHHLHLIVCEVFFGERLHHLLALIVQPTQLSRFVALECVARDQRHGDRGVGVAHHGVGQTVRVYLTPAHRLAG